MCSQLSTAAGRGAKMYFDVRFDLHEKRLQNLCSGVTKTHCAEFPFAHNGCRRAVTDSALDEYLRLQDLTILGEARPAGVTVVFFP